MKRYGIIVFVLTFLFLSNIYAIEYKSYKQGEEFSYKGISYYILEDSTMVDENLILIKKTPLTVAEVNQYGGDFINKYSQMYNGSAANMGGYGAIAYYTYDPNNNEYGGYNNFCIIKHNNSFVRTKDCFTYYYASDVNTLVSKWVSANFSESELIKDSFGSNYRILTDEDLIANFNYTLQPDNYTYKSTSAPS